MFITRLRPDFPKRISPQPPTCPPRRRRLRQHGRTVRDRVRGRPRPCVFRCFGRTLPLVSLTAGGHQRGSGANDIRDTDDDERRTKPSAHTMRLFC